MKKHVINAVESLENGNIICFPTDTILALGCNALNTKSIDEIYKLKGRKKSIPLSILVSDLKSAKEYANFSSKAELLAKKFWPGSLTIVVPIKENNILPSNINSGLNNIGIRVPSNLLALEILKKFNKPIVATSANYSGNPPATTIKEAKNYFYSKIRYISYQDTEPTNIASTVIEINNDQISVLRKGSVIID